MQPQDYQKFIKKLGIDSRVISLYNTELSIIQQFIYNQLRITPRLARQILLKTKDIVQKSSFELIYADTDVVFLKRTNASKKDFENIMDELIRETGLQMTFEYHYKFLVLLYRSQMRRWKLRNTILDLRTTTN